MEEQAMTALIARSKWKYAKTYPTAPHEYTVFDWNPSDEPLYREFAQHIQEHGEHTFWYRHPRIYFHFGDYKYWIMSNPQECILINRTFSNKDRHDRLLAITSDKAFQYKPGMTLASIEQDFCL